MLSAGGAAGGGWVGAGLWAAPGGLSPAQEGALEQVSFLENHRVQLHPVA